MKFGLQMNMAKLDLTEIEYVTLKAIVALDTNTPDVSRETAEILGVARESVQNALHLHLLEKYPSTQAISRFGRILMLSASITVRCLCGFFPHNVGALETRCPTRSARPSQQRSLS